MQNSELKNLPHPIGGLNLNYRNRNLQNYNNQIPILFLHMVIFLGINAFVEAFLLNNCLRFELLVEKLYYPLSCKEIYTNQRSTTSKLCKKSSHSCEALFLCSLTRGRETLRLATKTLNQEWIWLNFAVVNQLLSVVNKTVMPMLEHFPMLWTSLSLTFTLVT